MLQSTIILKYFNSKSLKTLTNFIRDIVTKSSNYLRQLKQSQNFEIEIDMKRNPKLLMLSLEILNPGVEVI